MPAANAHNAKRVEQRFSLLSGSAGPDRCPGACADDGKELL